MNHQLWLYSLSLSYCLCCIFLYGTVCYRYGYMLPVWMYRTGIQGSDYLHIIFCTGKIMYRARTGIQLFSTVLLGSLMGQNMCSMEWMSSRLIGKRMELPAMTELITVLTLAMQSEPHL